MKKGVSIWAFTEPSLEKCFETAKAAGFEGVEVALDEKGEVDLHFLQENAARVKTLAARTGIELYSVASGLFWKYSLTDNDPAIREKAERIAQKEIDVAMWLGCDTVLVVPGMVDENVPYDLAYNRALDAMKRLAPYAERHNVIIGIENVWNNFLLSPLEMRNFIDAVGSPFVQAYFDVGNVVRDGYPEQWIKILGKSIAKVHFKDYKRSVGTLDGFVDLLKGDVDYPAVLAALADTGYDGWVTAEVFPKDTEDFGAWFNSVSKKMDSILSR